jgi:hypothetical protein
MGYKMITGTFKHCTSLQQFYDEIVELQIEAHGEAYCDVHGAIKEALSPYGKRYVELGIHQGATLAGACLAGCEQVTGVDISLENYAPQSELFVDLGFRFNVIQGNAAQVDRVMCDVLYTDTSHSPLQLALELAHWAPFVSETIIIHDTHSKPRLGHIIDKFCEMQNKWKVKERNESSVGFTVLKKSS